MEATGATEMYCEQEAQEVAVTRESYLVVTGKHDGMAYRVVVDGKEDDRPGIVRVMYQAFATVDDEMNVWNSASAVSKLNATQVGEWVSVGPALCDVLGTVEAVHRETGGLFDPTVASLAAAFFAELDVADSADAAEGILGCLAKNNVAVGWRGIELDAPGHRARRTGDITVDLCGVAKGWWVDTVLTALVEHGYTEAYVEWGGDLRVLGDWDVAVARPSGLAVCKDAFLAGKEKEEPVAACRDGYLCTVPARNVALATSGDYTKLRRYGYNPNAFHPLRRRPMRMTQQSVSAATVAAATCVRADAYATALMLFEAVAEAVTAIKAWTAAFSAASGVHGCILQSRDEAAVPPVPFVPGGVMAAGALADTWAAFDESAAAEPTAAAAGRKALIPRHAHCRDLLRTIPKQMYVLSVEGDEGVHTVVLSSVVATPPTDGAERQGVFFSVMHPSRLAARLAETDGSAGETTPTAVPPVQGVKVTLFPLQQLLPDPLMPAFHSEVGGGVAAAGVRLYVRRVTLVGDHLGVLCDVGALTTAGRASPDVNFRHVVFAQHSEAVVAELRVPAASWPALDTRCVLYRTKAEQEENGQEDVSPTALKEHGTRTVVSGLRVFSRNPYILAFVAHGAEGKAWRRGDKGRLHVPDGGQGDAIDRTTPEERIRKLRSRQHGGWVLPFEMGHIDLSVVGTDGGIVYAQPSSAVARARPVTDVLLEATGTVGASPTRVAHPAAPKTAYLPPLVSFVVVLSALFALFVVWVVEPYMIERPEYDPFVHPARNRGARASW
eukprot:TRINITY_DN6308_c0_g1_i1.p1 TRINITY_DN6308_c0_g1~~TRINITY_DN6308_c0_g1_i1.p1  ORF type:complete len:781 (+),score=106.54 TRINITY_DN6308_c0_g1_i1:125-2467(+)